MIRKNIFNKAKAVIQPDTGVERQVRCYHLFL